ncbi:MAG: hypothetical protein IJ367_01530, partial [Clostridia bacterium]|nr:hypothetical protein [Clostridia bacterium]
DKEVIFTETGITLKNITPTWNIHGSLAEITTEDTCVKYTYKGHAYTMQTDGTVRKTEDTVSIIPNGDMLTITF